MYIYIYIYIYIYLYLLFKKCITNNEMNEILLKDTVYNISSNYDLNTRLLLQKMISRFMILTSVISLSFGRRLTA